LKSNDKVVYATNANIIVVKIGWLKNQKNSYLIMMIDRVEKLKEFLRANPSDRFVQHALALEMIKSGKDAEARDLFEDILNSDPTYIGSYYHLAKLLERTGHAGLAIEWYEKGIAAAKKANDQHAYHELQAALEDLQD
jgi:tetratricopeptide (TPR) repeat protein